MLDELRAEPVEPEAGEEGLEVLQMTTGTGTSFRLAFDPQTGLPRRMSFDSEHPMTGQPAYRVDTFSDYREVGGVMISHETKVTLEGADFLTILTTSCQVNQGLDPGIFARP